jgi:heterotetrameric sarcosine oxidase delta subunit
VSRLACPFCGARELEEFLFHKTLPEPDSTPYSVIYDRASRTEESIEHWQHVWGCRAWLWVRRNPSTNEVLEVRCLGDQEAP